MSIITIIVFKEESMSSKEKDIHLSFVKSMSILLFLLVAIYFAVVRWQMDPQIPIVLTTVYGAALAMFSGISWQRLEEAILDNINTVAQSLLVLLVIGIMLGTWLHSGVVPTMIYCGSLVISPKLFLPTACLVCSIPSRSTGDSWGTAGTVGIALMGIGLSFGIPAPMIAGAVVSGSYFGDKMSPMSDTTLLASAVAKADLFEHIKYMLWTTIPALVIAVVAYFFIGLPHAHNVNVDEIQVMLGELSSAVNINPILLLAPAFVIAMIALKIPALPALMMGTLIGSVFAVIFQGATLPEVMDAMHYGISMETGNELIDSLVCGGGLDYVMWTISLIFCAMALGGILDGSGAIKEVVYRMMKRINSVGKLVNSTIFTSFIINFAMADQYLAIIFPGKMFGEEYEKMGLHPKVLSRTLEDAGTLTSPLFPWNTCGAFIMSVLMVNPFAYAPYAILNWVAPIISIIYSFTGFKIAYIDNGKN